MSSSEAEADVPTTNGRETQVTDEEQIEAENYKTEANDCFKRKEFLRAIDLYSKAIEVNPYVAVYYGNRSFSYLKTESFGYALTDASRAIELDRLYYKGYYRRAAAYMSLTKFKLALKDLDTLMKAKPKDKDARLKYQECNKIVKQQAFAKAISVDDIDKTSLVDQLDLENMVIEDEYVGPSMQNDTVTLEFMTTLLTAFEKQEKLHRKYAYAMLIKMKKILEELPTLVDITVPDHKKFTVCGDIHGQFYDLLNIFKLNGLPSLTNPYLFNGDFVDRGSFSVEVILTLFGFKLLFPNHVYLSRGNHETSTMNQMYGFEGEVKSKFSAQMADMFTEVYCLLPLAHLINNKVLVMHGGLFSRDDVSLSEIRSIERNRQPPEAGIMCELLWSDPQPAPGRAPSKRGVAIQFGPDVTNQFLDYNNLDYIIRSHEVKADGYEIAHGGKCITVFSAPNYCDQMGNKGAFITLTSPGLKPEFTTYEAVPHPDVRPMAYANALLSLLAG